MSTPKKHRAPRKKPAAPPAVHDLPPLPEPPPGVDSRPDTHTFAYPDVGRYAVCACGAERDIVVRGGKPVRLYRAEPGGAWVPWIGVCAKYAPLEPEGPFDWRPNLPIPEDHYAAAGPAKTPVESPDEPAESRQPETECQESLADVLKKALMSQCPEAFAPEVINGCNLEEVAAESVMLDVACSPVLPHRLTSDPLSGAGDALIPVEAVPLDGDMYRVYLREGPRDVDAATLKVWRARYLLRRDELMRFLPDMEERDRLRICEVFFPKGQVPYIPPAGSPLAKLLKDGRPITIPRVPEGAPIDFATLIRTLTTPGAEIPTTCPTLPKETSNAE